MIEDINKSLKEKAITLGLCKQWQTEWKEDTDLFELADKFKRGQDFCIRHNYPSLEYIRQNFNTEEMAHFGIFVDELPSTNGESLPNDTYVCMGECEGDMIFGRWACALVYLRHESKVRIIAGEFAKISVRLYEDSNVWVECDDSAKVSILDRR